MFCEEIKKKHGISYKSLCPLRILYNSKFMLMATSLVTNAVVVTRVHCIILMVPQLILILATQFYFVTLLYDKADLIGSRHAKTFQRAYEGSEGPDQPAHWDLHCPLTESYYRMYMNGEQRPV